MSEAGGAAFTVRAGVDEAGYGPLLGPLTIGYSAFRCAAGRDVDWARLSAAVTDEPRSDATRIVVADSKKVFTRNPRGERRLETAALAFLRAAGRAANSGLDVVAAAPGDLAPAAALLARHPWYGELPSALPHRVPADGSSTCRRRGLLGSPGFLVLLKAALAADLITAARSLLGRLR